MRMRYKEVRSSKQLEVNSLHQTISNLRLELEEAQNNKEAAVQSAISSRSKEIKTLQSSLLMTEKN